MKISKHYNIVANIDFCTICGKIGLFLKMLSIERRHYSLSKEERHPYVWGNFEFCRKYYVIAFSHNITDIMISLRYIVDLSTIYLHTDF